MWPQNGNAMNRTALKEAVVRARVRPSEKAEWEMFCAQNDLPLSLLIRQCVKMYLKESGERPLKVYGT